MAPPPPSSTSNSKCRLALVFGPALALLLGYHLATVRGLVPASEGVQLSEQKRIRCEAYVHHRSLRPEVVFVGSSLTENLPVEDQSDRTFNLGLAGDSSWTGLEVLRSRSAFRPRILVVEVGDLLLRKANREILDSLLNPPARALREQIPMFRAEYQPLNVLLGQIDRWQKRGRQPPSHYPPQLAAALTARLIGRARTEGQILPSPDETARLRTECAHLRAALAEFAQTGTRCFLQRIPGDAALAETPRARALDAILDAEFPASQFSWVPPLPGFAGTTRDGVHLVEEDAAAYARHLCEAVLPAK